MKRVLLALLVLGTAACGTSMGQKTTHGRRTIGHVERATFTTAIQNREPRGSIRQLKNDQQKVYYFTELIGMSGQTVTHVWKYKGKVMAKVRFRVKGPRWRVYSSKWLETHWLGTWSASVVSRSGKTLSTSTFSYAQSSKRKRTVPAAAAADGGLLDRGASDMRSLWNGWFGDKK